MSTEIDCRACGEEVSTRRDHCPACWWRAHKRVPELEEWVRIYKVLRDAHKNHRRKLEAENEALIDALNHCGYDPDDCIDCGGPPHNEYCRLWKIRHLLSYWEDK